MAFIEGVPQSWAVLFNVSCYNYSLWTFVNPIIILFIVILSYTQLIHFFVTRALFRVEIRIQFHHVPGNLYRERIGHNIDLATNELTLQGTPDEAIFIKVNNKVPGLTLQLDASELNLLYKDK